MASSREEWYSLEPEEASYHHQHSSQQPTNTTNRPESVLSDIYTEDNTTSIQHQSQHSPTKFGVSGADFDADVSDVLSPDRRTRGNGYRFRVEPVGVSGGLSSKYLDRRVIGQEGVATAPRLTSRIMEDDPTQHSIEEVALNLSNEALSKAILDLSQHELDPSSLTQHPDSTNTSTSKHLSQIPFDDTTEYRTQTIDSGKEGVSTLSQHQMTDRTDKQTKDSSLSQYSIEPSDSSNTAVGMQKNSSVSQYPLHSSGDDSDGLHMFNSKDSRPGTVIERPITMGENIRDSMADQSTSMQFDPSIKYQHGQNYRDTIGGDTFLYNAGEMDKLPVVASTPYTERPSEGAGLPFLLDMASEHKQPQHQYLQMELGKSQGIDSESESDSNINKFMRKAGIEDYLPVEKRLSLLDEMVAATNQQEEEDNVELLEQKAAGALVENDLKDEVDFEKKSRDGSNRSPSNRSPYSRSSSASPGRFHELIPDTPSFRKHSSPTNQSQRSTGSQRQGSPTSQRSVGSQRSRASHEGGESTLEQFTLEESGVAHIPHSSIDSHGQGPEGSLVRERTSYDLFANKPHSANQSDNTGSSGGHRSEESSIASLPQPQHQRQHRRYSGSSSDATRDEPTQYKSSDTLLGYEGRDGMSVGSSGGKFSDYGGESSADEQKHAHHRPGSGRIVGKATIEKAHADEQPSRSPTEGQEQTSSKSTSSRQSPFNSTGDTTYRDEKWASKVADVVDSVARRQNLSQRVASILATAPANRTPPAETGSDKSTPVSRRSSQGPTPRSDDDKFNSTEEELLRNEATRMADLLRMARNSAPSSTTTSMQSDEDGRGRFSLHHTGGSNTPTPEQGATGLHSGATSEDEDVARITGEYKAILKGVTETVNVGGDLDALRSKLVSIDQEGDDVTSESTLGKHRASPDQNSVSTVSTSRKNYRESVEQQPQVNHHQPSNEASLDPTDNYENLKNDEALDVDVKRILAKYGREIKAERPKLLESTEDGVSLASSSRRSPAGSAYDTDDTLSHRVHELLAQPQPTTSQPNSARGQGLTAPEQQLQQLQRSMRSTNELEHTGESFQPSGLGSLQQRIDEAKRSGEPIGKAQLGKGGFSAISDPINGRVRNILAEDEEDYEDATSKQVSSFGSRSPSRTSSIDYHNLERDLDEIQSNLESLKGDIGGGGSNDSNISEQSAELLKYIHQKGNDETLQKTRDMLADQELDQEYDESTSSLSASRRKRLEPEGHHGCRSSPQGQGPRVSGGARGAGKLPVSPLLTSGVIPMDLALDLLHGEGRSKFTRYHSPGGSELSVDTDILLRQGGYSDLSRDDSGYTRDDSLPIHDNRYAAKLLAGKDPSRVDSLTDREVLEINGFKDDSGSVKDESVTERVSRLIDSEPYAHTPREERVGERGEIRIEYDQESNQYAYQTPKGGYSTQEYASTPAYPSSMPAPLPSTSQVAGLELSSISPLVSQKPFNAYGTMESLLASHRDKISATKFDESVEIRSPLRRQMDVVERDVHQYYDADGSLSLQSASHERLNQYNDRISPTELRINDPFRSMSDVEPRRVSSPRDHASANSSTRGTSPRDGANSRGSNHSLGSMSGLRPYKPPGSQTMYYVESGLPDVDGMSAMSETTVESTHPGSDDAIGPTLPQHAYGTRREHSPTRSGRGDKYDAASFLAHNKAASKSAEMLGTIQEQSVVGDSNLSLNTNQKLGHQNDISKQQQGNSRSLNATPQAGVAYSNSERERSFTKAHDWVNGNWPSREDLNAENHASELKRRDQADRSSNERSKSDQYEMVPQNGDRRTHSENSRYSLEEPASLKDAQRRSHYAKERIGEQPKYNLNESERYPQARVVSQSKSYTNSEASSEPSRHSLGGAKVRESHSLDSKISSDTSSSRSYEIQPYDEYSNKCQGLQSKYKSLKARAELAISQLINSSTSMEPDEPGYFKPDLSAAFRHAMYGIDNRKKELEERQDYEIQRREQSVMMDETDESHDEEQSEERDNTSKVERTKTPVLSEYNDGYSDGRVDIHSISMQNQYVSPSKKDYDQEHTEISGSNLYRESNKGQEIFQQNERENNSYTRKSADYNDIDGEDNLQQKEQEIYLQRENNVKDYSRKSGERDSYGLNDNDYSRKSGERDSYGLNDNEYSRKSREFSDMNKDNNLHHPQHRDSNLYQQTTQEKMAAFGTPQRIGKSRLSLEMSLNDTGVGQRSVVGGENDRRRSLNESVQSNSSAGSSHDFLKYHPQSQQKKGSNRDTTQPPAAVSESGSGGSGGGGNYRGSDYWSQVVRHNYDELEKKPAVPDVITSYHRRDANTSSARLSDVHKLSAAVSQEEELRMIDRLQRERAQRTTGYDRVSPVGQGGRLSSPDFFSPLEPDLTESPLKSRSAAMRQRSPVGRSVSPPGGTSAVEGHRSLSPYEAARSPQRTRSSYNQISRTDVSSAVGGSDPKSVSEYGARRSRSPDVQEMWERFQEMQNSSGSESDLSHQPIAVDLDKLSRLLSNPVKYVVSEMQQGSVFDTERNMEGRRSGQSVMVKSCERSLENNRESLPVRESRTQVEQRSNRAHSSGNRESQQRSGEGRRREQGERSHRGHGNGRSGDDGRDQDDDRYNRRHHSNTPIADEEANETEEEETLTEADTTASTTTTEPQKRKMAWVIKDEELLSIPEDSTLDSVSSDFTTSSEIDSDGKIVTKTTKRHLPGDPKLLRLQQKIAKQKEKYKRELVREQRRKDKITQLEALFHEHKKEQKKRKAQQEQQQQYQKDQNNTTATIVTNLDTSRSTTSTAKNTSTPSSERHMDNHEQDSTLGVSEITSTSTLTQATVISENGEDGFEENMSEKGVDAQQQVHFEDSDAASSVCACCQHNKSKHAAHTAKPSSSRSLSPPAKPSHAAQTRAREQHHHSASPARGRKLPQDPPHTPDALNLQQVTYSNELEKSLTLQNDANSRPSRKAVYLEIDASVNGTSTGKSKPLLKSKTRNSVSPSKRKEKENNENLKKKKGGEAFMLDIKDNKTSVRERSRSGSRKKKDESKAVNTAIQVTPKNKIKTQDFGATCPTPLVITPPRKHTVKTVTMVSEAIQTDRNGNTPAGKNRKNTPQDQNTTPPRHRRIMRPDHSPGMFTPESSGAETPPMTASKNRRGTKNLKDVKAHGRKNVVQAAQAGLSWFVAMPEPKPWRKPLRERQANAVAMETWPQMDDYTRKKVEAITRGGVDGVNGEDKPASTLDINVFSAPKTDLKSAFEKHMESFISKSRERQKHVALRSEERKINEIHHSQRMKIFDVRRRRTEANLEALPISDMHYRPRKRFISKKEMKKITKKNFAKLPEVAQRSEDKKREEAYKTNRLRAAMYKKRIQSKVLKKACSVEA